MKSLSVMKRLMPSQLSDRLIETWCTNALYVHHGARQKAEHILREQSKELGLSHERSIKSESLQQHIEEQRVQLLETLAEIEDSVFSAQGIQAFYRPYNLQENQEVEDLRLRVKYLRFMELALQKLSVSHATRSRVDEVLQGILQLGLANTQQEDYEQSDETGQRAVA